MLPGADPDLNGIGTASIRALVASPVATLPAIISAVSVLVFQPGNGVDHPAEWPWQYLRPKHPHQLLLRPPPAQLDRLQLHRRRHPQPPLLILSGIGILDGFLYILDGNESLEQILVIYQRQFFNLVFV